VEVGTAAPDEIEIKNLSLGEIALKNRLSCRARIQGETRIVLSPIVVYSNKIFKGSSRYKKDQRSRWGWQSTSDLPQSPPS